jgi:replicative DNA helicase
VEARSDHKPILSDLRESGSIEQDADIVIFIHREDMHREDSDRKGIADIIVAKHRNGPTDTVPLFFAKQHTRFHDIDLRVQPLE